MRIQRMFLDLIYVTDRLHKYCKSTDGYLSIIKTDAPLDV